ncbi:hypothetical protein BDV32DRAFT_154063 [Aspergillus pseudonomiae]|uniref:Uncharacterized protein n=1 Tax=Aspergillus pseudonomiae TaxID=1506151 RepID=A0A5N6HMD8_9EURO|nr:uncharacterized protein BDV37DRAFT_243165 [Aspergillus pseudonomiae]KAB8255651.1 hypothetical protein BDV32DRAFT_154063 [Aspergillus pseudonomiae]KAE8406427.1 hypothetical protein BDV37DRAFT_243165 [Aspergillus pseudonomiae]
MSMSGEQRNRQACEPCRRKKSKCTAERPVCSFCHRLNLQCVYLPREQAKSDERGNRVTKARSTKERFQALESEISKIYDILTSLHTHNDAAAHEASTSRSGEPREDSSIEIPNTLPQVGNSRTSPNFEPSCLEHPVEALDHFVEVYRTRIHLQPLPLFNLDGLRDRLVTSSRFLLYSFLALSLNFGSHEFYRGREQEAIELYTRSAEDATMKLAVEGISKIEVIESLCILALKDLIGQKPARAWMTIGTASRLDTLRRLTRHCTSDAQTEDRSARCHWSVFILEKAFSPQVLDLSSSQDTPDYPLSAPLPASPPGYRDENCPPDLHVSEEVNKDLGINAYHIDMVSVWGDLTRYLHGIRSGNVETPWLPESTHAKLSVRLYECEAKLPQRHLLRNVSFSKRSIAEIMQEKEYWSPWLAMQMLSHASPAILNHPFIHLVAMRGNRGVPQSRLFLQQAVDLALFHSGWVFQFIQFCENLQYEINDPLIGHAVAATATIPWLFQFARDPKVSKRACDDLGRCERFLSRISLTWPHITHKLEILQRLQYVAKEKLQEVPGGSIMISFQPQMLWELLDPKVCQVPQDDLASQGGVSQHSDVPDTRMRVTTQFVHPLLDEQAEQSNPPNPAGNAMYSFPPSPEDLEQVCLDEILAHFPREEFYWLEG